MKYTSAEAQKLLRSLREEENQILAKEKSSFLFNAAVNEDIEAVRPEYSLQKTSDVLAEVERKIRAVRHAINVFNTTTEIMDGVTIDEALVLLPQLGDRRDMLKRMAATPKMERARVYGTGTSGVIDYQYANFDPEYARQKFINVQSQIDKIQLALDRVNNTATMEIEL